VEKLVSSVARATAEQAAGAAQITTAAANLRMQADQTAKATAEQTKAVADMNTAANNVAKQIKLITRANREHSGGAEAFLNSLATIRGITERNANGAKEALNRTSGLLLTARRLAELAQTPNVRRSGKSGKSGRSAVTNGGWKNRKVRPKTRRR
jgi:methyl-accepting chemotaxis protein